MKKSMMFIVLVSVFLVLSACGMGSDGNTQNQTNGNGNTDAENDEDGSEANDDHSSSDSETGDSEDDSQSGENNSEDEIENTNDDSESVTQATGIYNGQADPHTIEIETEEGPLAFQLTMDARDDVEQLDEGEDVTYSYTEDGETRMIESIQMKD